MQQQQEVLDSPSPLHSDDYPSLELEDGLDGEQGGKRQRKGASTAERRATHNAVERARRETLNTRFQDLANILPNMANVKRPSKSAIVNKSIEYVQTSQDRERALLNQNDALRAEVNELRARLGINPMTPAVPVVQLPAPRAQRNREQSISSIHTIDSPHLSGSPSSTYEQGFNTALLAAGMTPPISYSPPACVDRRLSAEEVRVPSPPVLPVAPVDIKAVPTPTVSMAQVQQPQTSAFAMSAIGAAELGYWMGLQQQPQSNPMMAAFMNMQTGHLAGMPAWQNPFPQLPVSAAAGGDAMSWLFA